MYWWQKSTRMHFWQGLHQRTVHNHCTTFPPGRLMSFQSCCAQESPGGGGEGGGNLWLHPSLHQVTPCMEPRNSSLTRWIVMKFCTGTALKSSNLIKPRWLEFREGKLKFREVQLERVYCICVLWFSRFSSFFSVPLVQIWSRKSDLWHVIVIGMGQMTTTAFTL